MSSFDINTPLVSRFYNRYLDDGKVADFVRDVSSQYTLGTLQRISRHGDRLARRASVLALTILGSGESIPSVGEALRDTDRAVRLIAEDGLPAMWTRGGAYLHPHELQRLVRLNAEQSYAEAVALADRLLSFDGGSGETWHQRGVALTGEHLWCDAIISFQRALDCEPYHFPAAFALAQCHLELDDLASAVAGLEWTLRIHPHLEPARNQVRRLRSALREWTAL